jgi:hypothetical protein
MKAIKFGVKLTLFIILLPFFVAVACLCAYAQAKADAIAGGAVIEEYEY